MTKKIWIKVIRKDIDTKSLKNDIQLDRMSGE